MLIRRAPGQRSEAKWSLPRHAARDLDDPQQLTIPRLLAVFDRCKRIPPERALWARTDRPGAPTRRALRATRAASRRAVDAFLRMLPEGSGLDPVGRSSSLWTCIRRIPLMDGGAGNGPAGTRADRHAAGDRRSLPVAWTRRSIGLETSYWKVIGHGLSAEQFARSHVMRRLQAVAAAPSAILQSR